LDKDKAFEIAEVLEKFQKWVEDRPLETVMTIAEIEEKLGIKNLKIVKEVK
jgi:intein-encoded DNA endonuclease-like protein